MQDTSTRCLVILSYGIHIHNIVYWGLFVHEVYYR